MGAQTLVESTVTQVEMKTVGWQGWEHVLGLTSSPALRKPYHTHILRDNMIL